MESSPILIYIVAGIIILLGIIVLIKAGKRRKLSDSQQKFIKEQWKVIQSDSKHNPHKAILDADKLLAYILKARGYEGSVGDMLKKSAPLFRNINEVWEAHKMRNRVAHEIGLSLPIEKVESTISKFKRALQNLGAKL